MGDPWAPKVTVPHSTVRVLGPTGSRQYGKVWALCAHPAFSGQCALSLCGLWAYRYYRTTQAAAIQAWVKADVWLWRIPNRKWASLPVGVLPLLHACPKFRVPTSVGGVP